jgi:TPR repeat protein
MGPADYTEAVKWYRQAAEQGVAVAQNNLGVMYQRSYGVQQDYAEAVKWYRQAAEQGYAMAQSNLAFMYANGYGVDKDLTEAYKWMLLAGVNGFYSAEAITSIETNMTAKQMAEGRRLANEYLQQKKCEEKNTPPTGTEGIRTDI